MTELLTTGEMIHQLKLGERAKSGIGAEVERTKKGLYDVKEAYTVECDSHFLEQIWEIQPNYVSFAEAMKAVEEGKDVHCQYNGESIAIKSFNNKVSAVCFNKHCLAGGGAEIKIAWIVAGKWTIEGDE